MAYAAYTAVYDSHSHLINGNENYVYLPTFTRRYLPYMNTVDVKMWKAKTTKYCTNFLGMLLNTFRFRSVSQQKMSLMMKQRIN